MPRGKQRWSSTITLRITVVINWFVDQSKIFPEEISPRSSFFSRLFNRCLSASNGFHLPRSYRNDQSSSLVENVMPKTIKNLMYGELDDRNTKSSWNHGFASSDLIRS